MRTCETSRCKQLSGYAQDADIIRVSSEQDKTGSVTRHTGSVTSEYWFGDLTGSSGGFRGFHQFSLPQHKMRSSVASSINSFVLL